MLKKRRSFLLGIIIGGLLGFVAGADDALKS